MNRPLRILILDNTREPPSFGSKNIVQWALKTAPEGSEVLVRRAPDQDLPPEDIQIDALIVSGSVTSCLETSEPWIRGFDDFLIRHIEAGTPTLGICYGHQAIGRCLFQLAGQQPALRKSTHPELGWQTIEVTAGNPLLQGLDDKFVTYESHYEEIAQVPPGALGFARSEYCETQAYQVAGKPVFGIQFHPEYSVDEAERSLANKLKKGERKDWILNPGKGPKLYDENVGKTIFGNFFRIAGERKN